MRYKSHNMTSEELLQKVRKIEIKTHGLSRNIFAGEYHSQFKGRGMAFSEVREYQPGDDVRSIDWNVTARMNRPYIKIYEEERELTVMLLVDVSGSRNFGTVSQMKRDTMAEVAATLAFSTIENNDKVGGHYTNAVITFTLRQKQEDGSYVVGGLSESEQDLSDIDRYLSSVYVGEYEATTTGEHPTSYSVTVPASATILSAVSIEFPHVYFSVNTFPPGSDPEFEGFYYSNYRLTVSIVLLDEHGDEIAASRASDFVIYTNAKVRPSYIPAVVNP